MKKITIALAFATMFLFASNSINAQSYEKGSMILNIGVGVGGNHGGTLAAGFGTSGSFEIGIWPTGDFGVVGLGVVSGFVFSSQAVSIYTYDYTEFSIGPRGVYHFTIIPVENLDVYAAADLLFVSQTTIYNDGFTPNDTTSDVYGGAVAGVRYYFSDFFGVYGEVGYSVMFLSGGIALKFK